MDELISKRAVIEAIEKARANVGHNLERSIGKSIIEILDDVGRDVDRLPPALGTDLAEVGTDLISRDAVKELLNNNGLPYHINPVLWKELNDLPSAQPEIIRCAECKWFQCNMRQDGYLPKGVDEFECRHWCGYCDPTDFCSYAERR